MSSKQLNNIFVNDFNIILMFVMLVYGLQFDLDELVACHTLTSPEFILALHFNFSSFQLCYI